MIQTMLSGVNLRDLRWLLAVAEEMHFGRAAERLGVAQPQLSNVIRRLEDLSKVVIFVRRPWVRLTAAGAILVEMAKRIEAEFESGIDHAYAVGSGKVGTVRLGFPNAAMLGVVPTILKGFLDHHPEVTLNLVEGLSNILWDLLERNELDLIISREIRYDAGSKSVPIIDGDMKLVIAADHRLRDEDHIHLSDLRDEPFVFFRRRAAPLYFDKIISSCHQAGFHPNIVQEADSTSVILALVNAGVGVSFGLSQVGSVSFGSLLYKPIIEPMPSATFYLSFMEDKISPCASILMEHLTSRASSDSELAEGNVS